MSDCLNGVCGGWCGDFGVLCECVEGVKIVVDEDEDVW